MANFTSMSASGFTSFGNASNQMVNKVKLTINLSKKSSNKETILAYGHNSTIFASPKNDSSWIVSRAISRTQSALHISCYDHNGQEHAIDMARFLCQLFGAESAAELPDVMFKTDIGDIEAAEELLEGAGSISIIGDVNFGISDKEYKGQTQVFFHISNPQFVAGPSLGRTTLDSDFVLNCLSNAVVQHKVDKAYLSRYVRRQPVAPAPTIVEAPIAKPQSMQQMANKANEFTTIAQPKTNALAAAIASATFIEEDETPDLASLQDMYDDTAPMEEKQPKELPQNPGVGFGQSQQTTVSTSSEDWEDMDDELDNEDNFVFENLVDEAKPQASDEVIANLKSQAGTISIDNIL